MSRVITRQLLANKAAQRWFDQYSNAQLTWRYPDKEAVHEKLVQLGATPNPDDVDRAIGNGSWTSVKCDGCKKDVEIVVQVGEPLDYESSTANLCADCVSEAWTDIRRAS